MLTYIAHKHIHTCLGCVFISMMHATSFHVSRGAKCTLHRREHLERAEDTFTLHIHSNNSNSHNFFISTRISQIDRWDRPR